MEPTLAAYRVALGFGLVALTSAVEVARALLMAVLITAAARLAAFAARPAQARKR